MYTLQVEYLKNGIAISNLSNGTTFTQGAQPRLKSWGRPRFGSQHGGACAPRPARVRAGSGCGRGSPPPAVGSGLSPPENFWKLRYPGCFCAH